MADGVAVAKIIAMLGFIVIFTAALSGSTPAEWTNAQNTIAAGIDFPEFWNPFSPDVIRVTAYTSHPFRFGFHWDTPETPYITMSGCENTTFSRSDCLATADADTSYLRFDEDAADDAGFFYNYSNPQLADVTFASVRSIVVTLMCRTLPGESSPFAFHIILSDYFSDSGGTNASYEQEGFCPKGDTYQNIVFRREFEGDTCVGAACSNTIFIPFGNRSAGYIYQRDYQNVGGPIALFTYLRLDVEYAVVSECRPPEGAWFPALDEAACAIMGFANFVWRGIQLVGSAIAFVILSVAAVLGFVGSIVGNLLLGAVSVYGSLFNLGAPSPVQEIIDVLAIAVAGYLILQIVFILRGS